MKLKELKILLYDARFIKIIEILNSYNSNLAIYLIRYIAKCGLVFSKNYVSRLERFKKRMRNPMQYWDKK